MDRIRLGRTGMTVTRVGFGGIPIQRLGEGDAVAVVKRCLELGVNFIDTANAYTTSEERIGKAVAGHRQDVIIATKTLSRRPDGIAGNLQLSLERLGTDYIDLYQLHSVSDFATLDFVLAPGGALDALLEAKKAGKIRHIGITSHQIDVAKKAVESDKFETIMFPFNFVTDEAAEQLLPLCRKHDVGFIDMKPLAGGMISSAAIAFRYLFQFPDVATIPGIEKAAEIEEIVSLADGHLGLTDDDRREMASLKQRLGTRFCHRCDYCQPCKAGIAISTVMSYPSLAARLPGADLYGGFWSLMMAKAAECTKCHECEDRCPYHLPITDMVAEFYEQFEKDRGAYQRSK